MYWTAWRSGKHGFGKWHIAPEEGPRFTICGKPIPERAQRGEPVSRDLRKVPHDGCQTCVWRELDHGRRSHD